MLKWLSGQFNSNYVAHLPSVSCAFSLDCTACCCKTVCWHVGVFVQPRFSSSTECIYRTTPSNPDHSKVAHTDTQAICFPIMFLCDNVERSLKQHTGEKQFVSLAVFCTDIQLETNVVCKCCVWTDFECAYVGQCTLLSFNYFPFPEAFFYQHFKLPESFSKEEIFS